MNINRLLGPILLLFSGACIANNAPAAKQTPALRVHVNQVVLERTGPKSAIVEYAGAAAATQFTGKFEVLKDGAVVHAGSLAALPAFDEWGRDRKYFEADFSPLAANGTYQLQVTLGERSTKSPSFSVADNAAFVTTVSAVLDYFKANRHTKEADKKIRIYDTQRYVNVWGGWKDAGGDSGKYLSHLSYANFFNPQQAAMAVWALGKSYEGAPALYDRANLKNQLLHEVMWGADYLHRLLDPEGYFYLTVFDKWATPGAERVVTGYVGIDGVYTENYQAAFREGAGVAIAALARAARLSKQSGVRGEFSAAQYLADAEKGFAHLQKNNPRYCDDGVENIIDDYTALLAAIELFHSTSKGEYLQAARQRAANINKRMTKDGWFVSDAGSRPYYHGAEAGFPILALVYYLDIEQDRDRANQTKSTIAAALDYQLKLNRKVSNPYNYARQSFKIYKDGKLGPQMQDGFFMPHANETGYWWQGESARLASLATAAILGGRITAPDRRGAFGVRAELAEFAQNQLDWTLGRNPYDLSLLYGFGARNPPSSKSAGDMEKGGISNGITGGATSDEGRGIDFAAGPEDNNWRWVEQWLPHSTWFLLAATAMTDAAQPPQNF